MQYETYWRLRNGRRVLLRPIKPEDEPYMDELFKAFSRETVRYRFFMIVKEMSHAALARYCNVDYDREIAIVAEARENGRRRLLGLLGWQLSLTERCGNRYGCWRPLAEAWLGL